LNYIVDVVVDGDGDVAVDDSNRVYLGVAHGHVHVASPSTLTSTSTTNAH
jgi:hypothetical protein